MIHLGVDNEPSWGRQTFILRRQNPQEMLPDTGMTKDKANRNRDQTVRILVQTSEEKRQSQTGQKPGRDR